uniref:Uncharacterized protein n=1 Tax=Romanomermis culicivorax TaxID=13658 RepID=A0A915HG51_ROMCU
VRNHKPQFTIDLGTCIISYNAGSSDSVVINDDEEIFCLKVKEEDKFVNFLESIQKHKVYQQDYLAYLNAEQKNSLDLETGSLVACRRNSGHIVQDVKIAKPNLPDKVPVEYRVSQWLEKNEQPRKGENPGK